MVPKYKYYQVGISLEMVDEKGKTKKIKQVHLVDSPDTQSVERKVKEAMEGSMYDWEITSIILSKITEVYGD